MKHMISDSFRRSLRVRTNGNIYGVDLEMPFCNNMQVMNMRGRRLTGEDEPEECYLDGLGRQNCNRRRTVEFCTRIADIWGLDDVFC